MLQRWIWSSGSGVRPTRLPAIVTLPLGLRQHSSKSWKHREESVRDIQITSCYCIVTEKRQNGEKINR